MSLSIVPIAQPTNFTKQNSLRLNVPFKANTKEAQYNRGTF